MDVGDNFAFVLLRSEESLDELGQPYALRTGYLDRAVDRRTQGHVRHRGRHVIRCDWLHKRG